LVIVDKRTNNNEVGGEYTMDVKFCMHRFGVITT
jgi:hypothetical protein